MIILVSVIFLCASKVLSEDAFGDDAGEISSGKALFEILDRSYDFIVIGAGTSGSVIANRLSEIPDWTILLLETGEDPNPLTQVPLFTHMTRSSNCNWNFTMEPSPGSCKSMIHKRCTAMSGRAMGGTTVVDNMIYSRGDPNDYSRWVDAGNKGWSYEDVLPYFMRSEDCSMDEGCFNEFHRQGGYQSVSRPYQSKLANAFIEAGLQMGYNLTDYNTNITTGFSRIQSRLKRGRRQTTASAFLDPIRNRRNLYILDDATVSKILIDTETKTAYGVEFYKRINKHIVMAKKEVILSAGTFNSPKLLMLSGVGPKDQLKMLGIPLIKSLHVGDTFYDHITFPGLVYMINETVEPRQAILDPRETADFLFNGRGFFASLSGIEAVGFIKTNTSEETDNYPDVQLTFSGIGSLQFDLGAYWGPSLHLDPRVYDEAFKPIQRDPVWSIFATLLHPKSKGQVKLGSRNFRDHPIIYGNYLTEETDVETLLAGVRVAQRLADAKSFRRYNSTLYHISIPDCVDEEFDSDDFWRCAIKSLSSGMDVDQTGTCKMGPASDPNSVVDNRFKVHGISNLRVADRSVIPVTMSAETSAVTIMLGERVGDMIKELWIGKD